MPELPEVETTILGILPYIKGQVIEKVIVRDRRLRWAVPSDLETILCHEKVLQIQRRAKYILMTMLKGTLIIHLGMSGHLRILKQPTVPKKHDHIDICFKDQTILRFSDPRRFGAFLWTEGRPSEHFLLKNLGVEPLGKFFTVSYFAKKISNKKAMIKTLLMDNKIVVGIGNIYATEALFAAKIAPEAEGRSLSLDQIRELIKSVRKILRSAIKRGGTTLKNFLNSNGVPGYFSLQLKVYGRAGLRCLNCNTVLKSVRIAQRSTVYCKKCQSLR